MYAQKAIPFEDYETGRCFLRHGEITGTPASLMDLYSGLKRKTPSGTATRRLRTGSLSKQRKSCGPATSVSIGRKRQKIVNKPKSQNGLVVTSDSDMGGMYAVDGDLRTHGASAIFYKDMIVDYWTGSVGTVDSSGCGETLALSRTLKRAMHVKYVVIAKNE